MAGRRHLVAVNRQISASGLLDRPEHAALVDLARNLARRMDSVGSDDAPISLLNSYQSALGRLERAASQGVSKRGRDGVEKGVVEPAGRLEMFKRRWRVRPDDRLGPDVYANYRTQRVQQIHEELERLEARDKKEN